MSLASEALIGVGLWITRRERSEERDDLAVRSVLAALNATKLYLARREAGEPIDREAEPELVELWTSASVQIRRTDFDLAQTLQEKLTIGRTRSTGQLRNASSMDCKLTQLRTKPCGCSAPPNNAPSGRSADDLCRLALLAVWFR